MVRLSGQRQISPGEIYQENYGGRQRARISLWCDQKLEGLLIVEAATEAVHVFSTYCIHEEQVSEEVKSLAEAL
jgi:hypothetical protein